MQKILNPLFVSLSILVFSFNSWALVGGTCTDYMNSTKEDLTPSRLTLLYNLSEKHQNDFFTQMDRLVTHRYSGYNIFENMVLEWNLQIVSAVQTLEADFSVKGNLYHSIVKVSEFQNQLSAGRALYLLLTEDVPSMLGDDQKSLFQTQIRSSIVDLYSKLKSLREFEIRVLSETTYMGTHDWFFMEFPGLDPKTRPFTRFKAPKDSKSSYVGGAIL